MIVLFELQFCICIKNPGCINLNLTVKIKLLLIYVGIYFLVSPYSYRTICREHYMGGAYTLHHIMCCLEKKVLN